MLWNQARAVVAGSLLSIGVVAAGAGVWAQAGGRGGEVPLEKQGEAAVNLGPREDAARILGNWSLVSSVRGREAELLPGVEYRTALFTGEACIKVVGVGGSCRLEATPYKLDPAAEPKAIDLIAPSGSFKGKTFPAIYQFEGDDTLALAFGEPGHARPSGFGPAQGSVRVLTYRRAADDDREGEGKAVALPPGDPPPADPTLPPFPAPSTVRVPTRTLDKPLSRKGPTTVPNPVPISDASRLPRVVPQGEGDEATPQMDSEPTPFPATPAESGPGLAPRATTPGTTPDSGGEGEPVPLPTPEVPTRVNRPRTDDPDAAAGPPLEARSPSGRPQFRLPRNNDPFRAPPESLEDSPEARPPAGSFRELSILRDRALCEYGRKCRLREQKVVSDEEVRLPSSIGKCANLASNIARRTSATSWRFRRRSSKSSGLD